MKRAILCFLFITAAFRTVSGQEKPKSLPELRTEYEALKTAYYNKKAGMLKQREALKDERDSLDDELRSLYQKRNALLEESYLLKDGIQVMEQTLEDNSAQDRGFAVRIEEIADTEKKKLRSKFPYLMEKAIQKLNLISDITTKGISPVQAAADLIAYKRFLIQEGEKCEVYETEIMQEEKKTGIRANILRIGFIFNALASGEDTGYLLRKGGVGGIYYEWIYDMPVGIKNEIRRAVNTAFSRAEKSGILISVPVDAVQAGGKIKAFISGTSFNILKRFYEYLVAGGITMFPLILLALLALYLLTERLYFYQRKFSGEDKTIFQLSELIKENRVTEAEKLCTEGRTPGMKIISFLFQKTDIGRAGAEKLLEEHFSELTPEMNRRLPTLAVLAAIAPLLGLLGTVAGMITLFDVITIYGTANPRILAGGISVALITTQTGLTIAIPIMLIHHFLQRKKTAILDKLENAALIVLNRLYPETSAKD